jgi:hypothetical protein
MKKYDNLLYLKKTKARVNHFCSRCGKGIERDTYYYIEAMKDRFLQRLHAKKFCVECYEDLQKK